MIVVFWIGDPDDLHFCLLASQSKVDLFMPRIVGHLDAGNPDKLFKSDLMVEIRVEETEYGCALSSG